MKIMTHDMCISVAILLFSKISSTTSDVTFLDLIRSLPEAQQFLDAYNQQDYVLAAIKLIDLKFKADPPVPNSRDEKLLLFYKKMLVKIHPNYLRGLAKKKELNEQVEEIKTQLVDEKAIQDALNALNIAIVNTNTGIDGVINFLINVQVALNKIAINETMIDEKSTSEDGQGYIVIDDTKEETNGHAKHSSAKSKGDQSNKKKNGTNNGQKQVGTTRNNTKLRLKQSKLDKNRNKT